MHIIFKDNFCWWTHQNHIHLNNGDTNLHLYQEQNCKIRGNVQCSPHWHTLRLRQH